MLCSSLAIAYPADAAAGAAVPSQVSAHALDPTVHTRGVLTVVGAVKPVVAGRTVQLQRLVGSHWKSLASGKSTAAGTFSFSVRAPKAPAPWLLRVAQGTSVSATLRVRVTATAYVVTAATAFEVGVGTSSLVTGTVTPRASGLVRLQRLVGGVWTALASARLSADSTFSVAAALPPGVSRLRVVKPSSAVVSAGVSKAMNVTVQPAPTDPIVITTALPDGTAGRPYAASLSAAGGRAPYRWSVAGAPSGLAMAADGRISGTPTAVGSSTLTVIVLDADGRVGTSTFSLRVVAAPISGEPVVEGPVRAWGGNGFGQLGNGTAVASTTPVAVQGLTGVSSVVSADYTSFALLADGTVWAWGYDGDSELGNGTIDTSTVRTDASTPVQVHGLSGVVAIAAGAWDGYALLADGTVWSWGANGNGERGDGSWTEQSLVPVQVSGLADVTAIAGEIHGVEALRSDGTVWGWGLNDYGQLGIGAAFESNVPVQVAGLPGVVAIAGGWHDGYALAADGTVWAWGDDSSGQLGNSADIAGSLVPVQVAGLAHVSAIASAFSTGYALSSDGTVSSWGSNAEGELGVAGAATGDAVRQVSGLASVRAVAAGFSGGYALRADGTVWSWGSNVDGQLGDGTTTDSEVPVQVSGLSGVTAIAGGGHSAYALVAGSPE
jgi:alpha-tubulin suppressor-like RCC1 family protein